MMWINIKDVKKVIKGEKPLIDVWHFLVGNYRYKLYYNKWLVKLIRKHIKEQIDYRIKWMDRECYERGSCKICGCETTALQMADKSCDKPCYPDMMKEKKWRGINNCPIAFNRQYTHCAFVDHNGIWRKDNSGQLVLVVKS